MTLTPCLSLSFDGRCETALRFYEQTLNATTTFMLRWGDSPMSAQAPPDWSARIAHASFTIGGASFAGSDVPPEQYEPPRGFEILLNMDDRAAAERVFEALGEDGRIKMPLQETFWAARFGVVVDRFGISWAVNCENPAERRTAS